ncbi:MAG: hypothetical protein QM664_02800 [Flavihumibacter sp.]
MKKAICFVIIIAAATVNGFSQEQVKKIDPVDLRLNYFISGIIDTAFRQVKCNGNGLRTTHEASVLKLAVKRRFYFIDPCEENTPEIDTSAQAYFNRYDIDNIDGKPLSYFTPKIIATAMVDVSISTRFRIHLNHGNIFASPSKIATVSIGGGRDSRLIQVVEYYELFIVDFGFSGISTCTHCPNICGNFINVCNPKFYLGKTELQKDLGVIVPLFYCVMLGG